MSSTERNPVNPLLGPHSEGYQQATVLLRECLTDHGFLATPSTQANYRRIWGRDSTIMGLAALLSDRDDLIEGCRCSLETLARNQGPHGEIPSNVDPGTGRVSYGGTTGRVDADLWFIIGCGAYWRHTGDDAFLHEMIEPLQKVQFLLGAWEFNTRGLLYVPPTGDWADEYVHSGYVLYDQLLYLQAQREIYAMQKHIHLSGSKGQRKKIERLKRLIRANFWFMDNSYIPEDVYHKVLYEKGRKAAPNCGGPYWMAFFSPLGYGYRFDALANILVSLFNVADDAQCNMVDEYIAQRIVHEDVMLLPAFDPVIRPKDEKWDDLQMSFSYSFKNAPHEYHNGGLWPLVTGFYAASLANRGKLSLAQKYCEGIYAANRAKRDGKAWSFPEYLHGQNYRPSGASPMGWSAAAAIIAERHLHGKRLDLATEASAGSSD